MPCRTTILSGETVLLCDAESHRDMERWIKLSDEFGFEIAVSGGRDAWRLAETLANRDIPVVLTLDWGKAASPIRTRSTRSAI